MFVSSTFLSDARWTECRQRLCHTHATWCADALHTHGSSNIIGISVDLLICQWLVSMKWDGWQAKAKTKNREIELCAKRHQKRWDENENTIRTICRKKNRLHAWRLNVVQRKLRPTKTCSQNVLLIHDNNRSDRVRFWCWAVSIWGRIRLLCDDCQSQRYVNAWVVPRIFSSFWFFDKSIDWSHALRSCSSVALWHWVN